MLRLGVPRHSTTYSFFSSGENARPLGFSRSVITALSLLSVPMRYTLVVACSDLARVPSHSPLMPNSGSVNQMVSSDLTTMSLGELSFLPSKLSASTVDLPSFSKRTTRRVTECSQLISRPWRSRVLPLA